MRRWRVGRRRLVDDRSTHDHRGDHHHIDGHDDHRGDHHHIDGHDDHHRGTHDHNRPGDDEPLPEGIERLDYLTFAQGAVPIGTSLEGPGEGLTNNAVMQAIDGNPTPRLIVDMAAEETTASVTLGLPAPTTFDRFAVPQVLETPSPSATFFREIEILGADSAGGDFVVLARGVLETHGSREEVSELEIVETVPVSAVKISLSGGIEILQEPTVLEFSEIIGNGVQEPAEFVEGFTGIWDAQLPDIERSIGLIELKQDGATVTGCFGRVDLTGTVTGNLVRLTGVDRDTGIPSAYVFGLEPGGQLIGAVSTNGAPFNFTPSLLAPEGSVTDCSDVPQPEHALGCGAIVYGINFDFNSADLRPDSAAVLQELFEGLQADGAAAIVVEGHTSTEGSDSYNQDLSERRAQAVVDDLIGRGIEGARISASGRGEAEPLVSPDNDEASRSINRRVEIVCG